MPSRVPLNAKRDGSVYFSYKHASDSFSGHLDDSLSMTDDQVREYIQYGNPTLYESLHRLPFSSTDIPQSFTAQKSLKKAYQMQQTTSQKTGVELERHIPAQLAREISESVFRDDDTERARTDFESLDLQLKRRIITSLLGGVHSLVLRKLSTDHDPLLCHRATCPSDGLVFYNTFYLTLQMDIFPFGYTGLREPAGQSHYCLTCLEEVFDGNSLEVEEVAQRVASTTFDGIDHHHVMKAASRLYQGDNETAIVEVGASATRNPEPNHHRTPNQGSQSRLHRKQDIDDTLKEVGKFEKRRSSSQESSGTDVLPSLWLSRPPYMEASRDRYKKQGWRPWDRQCALRKQRETASTGSQTQFASPISSASDSSTELFCYCREPDLGEDAMIRCYNEWCSIGWFHSQCVDMQGEPPEDGIYLCENCREDCGPFAHAVDVEKMKELTATNDAILDCADQKADEDFGVDWQIEDEDEDGEHDEDEDEDSMDNEAAVSTVPTPPWGTPINRRANEDVSHISPMRTKPQKKQDHTNTSPCKIDASMTAQFDGSTNVNPQSTSEPQLTSHTSSTLSTPTGNLYRQTSSESTVVDTSTSHDFSDFAHVRFVDLAPFISADETTLSESEVRVFEDWKHNLPPSRLVRAMLSGGTPGERTEVDCRVEQEFGCDENEVVGRKLSDLLNSVGCP